MWNVVSEKKEGRALTRNREVDPKRGVTPKRGKPAIALLLLQSIPSLLFQPATTNTSTNIGNRQSKARVGSMARPNAADLAHNLCIMQERFPQISAGLVEIVYQNCNYDEYDTTIELLKLAEYKERDDQEMARSREMLNGACNRVDPNNTETTTITTEPVEQSQEPVLPLMDCKLVTSLAAVQSSLSQEQQAPLEEQQQQQQQQAPLEEQQQQQQQQAPLEEQQQQQQQQAPLEEQQQQQQECEQATAQSSAQQPISPQPVVEPVPQQPTPRQQSTDPVPQKSPRLPPSTTTTTAQLYPRPIRECTAEQRARTAQLKVRKQTRMLTKAKGGDGDNDNNNNATQVPQAARREDLDFLNEFGTTITVPIPDHADYPDGFRKPRKKSKRSKAPSNGAGATTATAAATTPHQAGTTTTVATDALFTNTTNGLPDVLRNLEDVSPLSSCDSGGTASTNSSLASINRTELISVIALGYSTVNGNARSLLRDTVEQLTDDWVEIEPEVVAEIYMLPGSSQWSGAPLRVPIPTTEEQLVLSESQVAAMVEHVAEIKRLLMGAGIDAQAIKVCNSGSGSVLDVALIVG
jgi:chemotaxis protein histidine kinase CheA